MAKTVSSASIVSTSSKNKDNIIAPNNSTSGLTYNGMNVYASEYCPVCHKITKVTTTDGTVYDVVNDEEIPASQLIPETDESSNSKKYVNPAVPESQGTTSVLAENVIEDSNHMFVTQEILQQITTIVNQYMSKLIYDQDDDGVVDISRTTKNVESVDWDSVTNVPYPLTDPQGLSNLMIHHHHHRNLDALRKIGQNRHLEPTWNNTEWPYPQKAKPNQLSAPYMRNIFISLSDPRNADIGDIWLEVETFDSQRINGLYIKKEDGTWYRWHNQDIEREIIEIVQRAISNLSHENLKNLQGGEPLNRFHITEEQYNALLVMLAKDFIERGEPNCHVLTDVEYDDFQRLRADLKYRDLTPEEYVIAERFLFALKTWFPEKWYNIDVEDYPDNVDTNSTALTKQEYYSLCEILDMYDEIDTITYNPQWINIEGYDCDNYSHCPDMLSYMLTVTQIKTLFKLIDQFDNNTLNVDYDWIDEGGEWLNE